MKVKRMMTTMKPNTGDLLLMECGRNYGTILADPPWRFQNRSGKMAPEYKRLARYQTMDNEDIRRLPVKELGAAQSHLYLWVPNTLLQTGLDVMRSWGYDY